jgi:hypothetical protein
MGKQEIGETVTECAERETQRRQLGHWMNGTYPHYD